jgi:23S rRNA (adenine2030-N6)-methyltransferase
MLGYRHAFHAGNHADVLKHLVLVRALEHMCAKDKPFWYIDTHAGAGRYALERGFATKLREYQGGIERLWQEPGLPLPLQRYLEVVRSLNPGGQLRHYPGSPWIAQALMRPQDRLWLHELHPADYALLEREFRNVTVPSRVLDSDGYAGLRALLPPEPRRALVLIDPSYEVKDDYAQLLRAMQDGLQRFPTGVFIIWYPMIARREARELPRKLAAMPAANWLRASLVISAADSSPGLYGSGVFVINPPHTLATALEESLPRLAELFALDAHASFSLESSDH